MVRSKLRVLALMGAGFFGAGAPLAQVSANVPDWVAKHPFSVRSAEQIRSFLRCDHPEVTLNARVQAQYVDTLSEVEGLVIGVAAFGREKFKRWDYLKSLVVGGVQVKGFMRHPGANEALTLVLDASIDELVAKGLVVPEVLRQCQPLSDSALMPGRSRVCSRSIPLDTSHLTEAPFGPHAKLNALLILMEGAVFLPESGQTLLSCTLMPREGNPYR